MEYYNNILTISFSELTDGIISKSYYDNLVSEGKVVVVRRGCRGTKALINFDKLPSKIRESAIRKYGNPKEYVIKSILKDFIEIDAKAEAFYSAYKLADGRNLPIDVQQEYCTNAAILKAVSLVVNDRVIMRRALLGGTRSVWKYIAIDVDSLKGEFNHSLPSCVKRLREKVSEYNKQGYEYLISKKYLNKNSSKVADFQKEALLRELMSKNNNFDNEQLKELYNTVAITLGWEKLSSSTVANYRKKWGLQTFAGRAGETAFRNTKAMLVKRKAPSYPFYYWTLDGWDVELLYQKTETDAKGYALTTYHNRLTAVIVLDPSVKYPIGYAVGTHETKELIKEALRNAMIHSYELFGSYMRPLQLQSDNYGKGVLTPLYQAVTTHYTPARVHNAKSKVIEPYNKYLNKKYCQMFNNWSGLGLKARKESQPNGDYLQKIKKDFPDELGCKRQFEQIMELDRAQKIDRFRELFNEMPESDKISMTQEEYLFTLGETTGYTNRLESMGLRPTIMGVKKEYDSYDRKFRELSYMDWTIKYDPNNLNTVLATSTDGTYRFMLQEKYIQPMALKERTENDTAELKQIGDYNKSLESSIIAIRSKDIEEVKELFDNNPALNDTLTKFILTDSRGQHKDNKSAARLNGARKMLEKQNKQEEKTELKTWKETTDEYLKEKVDISEYL